MIEPNCRQVLDVAWEYWGIYEFMDEHPGLYGMDKKRVNCHERLCLHYKLEREDTLIVTDHLNQFKNAVQMHEALVKIKEKVDGRNGKEASS